MHYIFTAYSDLFMLLRKEAAIKGVPAVCTGRSLSIWAADLGYRGRHDRGHLLRVRHDPSGRPCCLPESNPVLVLKWRAW